MTAATTLLSTLRARQILISAHGDRLRIDAPRGALTDEDRRVIRDHKAELLAALQEEPAPQPDADRPRLGSFARPMVCRGDRMPRSCVWDTCDGQLVAMGRDLYQCGDCGTWFQLLAPETGFVYVGDLANDFDRETKTEWTM